MLRLLKLLKSCLNQQETHLYQLLGHKSLLKWLSSHGHEAEEEPCALAPLNRGEGARLAGLHAHLTEVHHALATTLEKRKQANIKST